MAALAACFLAAVGSAADWPQWRGPELRGTSPERGLPVRWSTKENVAFRLALPDLSGSTPIVLGHRVFLHVAAGDTLELWCVDRRSGSVASLRGQTLLRARLRLTDMSPR